MALLQGRCFHCGWNHGGQEHETFFDLKEGVLEKGMSYLIVRVCYFLFIDVFVLLCRH